MQGTQKGYPFSVKKGKDFNLEAGPTPHILFFWASISPTPAPDPDKNDKKIENLSSVY